MNKQSCNNCIHYKWVEDYFDDGLYTNVEYCENDINRPCGYYQPACEFFEEG